MFSATLKTIKCCITIAAIWFKFYLGYCAKEKNVLPRKIFLCCLLEKNNLHWELSKFNIDIQICEISSFPLSDSLHSIIKQVNIDIHGC